MLNELAISKDERINAALAHGSIVLGVFSRGTLGILVAFLIWITQRGKSPFAARQALQALLYQFVTLVVIIAVWIGWGILMAGSVFVPELLAPGHPESLQPFTMIPAILLIVVPFAVMIASVVYGIYAAVQVSHGKDFAYPIIGGWIR